MINNSSFFFEKVLNKGIFALKFFERIISKTICLLLEVQNTLYLFNINGLIMSNGLHNHDFVC